MDKRIKKRVFLFGCSRSGTTLLQVVLARHPDIYTLPETFFFDLTIGNRRKTLAQLNITTGQEKKGLAKVAEILRLDSSQLPYIRSVHYRPTADTFINYLDERALAEDKEMWLEKTPFHINYIDIIKKYVANVHFIHIVRDGKDTVASIVDRANKHDKTLFGQQQQDPAYGIRKWNNAIKISQEYLGDPLHSFVSYEMLTHDPDTVLAKLCQELGIDFHPSIKNSQSDQQERDLTKYAHLANSSGPIRPTKSKFDDVFDESTQSEITKKLDWEKYQAIKESIQQSLASSPTT